MFEFRDKENRLICIERIDCLDTYYGFLEGSKEIMTKMLLRNLSARMIDDYGDHRPIQVHIENRICLPEVRIFLDMRSRDAVPVLAETNQLYNYSVLGLCIFMSIPASFGDILQIARETVEWNTNAMNRSSLDD